MLHRGRLLGVLACTVLVFLILSPSAALAGQQLGDLTGPWQLLIDDFLVQSKTGIVRTYHPFQKYAGNPVIQADKPWEGTNVYLYGTILPTEDGSGYRMWYHFLNYAEGVDGSCYATSTDGLHWNKPTLGLFPYKGSTANNIYTTRGGSVSVMHTPFNPEPQRRYTHLGYEEGGYYGGWSADGIHWDNVPTNPLVGGGDVAHATWDPHQRRYLGYYKTPAYLNGLRRRAVAFSETTDFSSWPAPQLILAPDDLDDWWVSPGSLERTHFYGFCVFPYESAYLGFLWILRSVEDGFIEGTIHVEIASSRDGVHWTREEGHRPAILELGPAGAWDDGMVFTSTHPLVEGDTMRLYYGGFDDTHAQENSWHAKIGLATLRKDGFASLDAGTTTGTVLTKRLVGLEGPLHVNYRASGGWLKAEVLDEFGQVIAGYDQNACQPLQGDSIDQVVTWTGHSTLPAGPGPLRLRFILRNAGLYSFQAGSPITIIDPPTITRQPVDRRVLIGGTARFSLESDALAPTTYQWQKNGLDLADGGHYSGTNTASLVISQADGPDAAGYRCVVTHPYGTTISESARLVLGRWAFTGVGVRPGAADSAINGLSSDGSVAAGLSGGQAVIWSVSNGLQVLGLPSGATWSSAAGVGLYQGQVVAAVDTNRSANRAWRWIGTPEGTGTFTALPRVGGAREWTVRGLGTDGTDELWIAGSTIGGGDLNGREACLYEHTVAATNLPILPSGGHDHSDLRAVSDNGRGAGQYQYGGSAPSGGARNAMAAAGGACTSLDTLMGVPSTVSEAVARTISRDGQTLGGGSNYGSGGLFKPVLWQGSTTPTAIPFLAGGDADDYGEVLALNGDGTLAGGYSYRNPSGAREAFIWDSAHGTRSLQQVLTAEHDAVLTGWTLQEVRSISADGVVLAGVGLNNGATEGWVVAFIPTAELIIGDFNNDRQVDAADLEIFTGCVSGPSLPLGNPEACAAADLDEDHDVDQSDFGQFQHCLTGPVDAPPADCIMPPA